MNDTETLQQAERCDRGVKVQARGETGAESQAAHHQPKPRQVPAQPGEVGHQPRLRRPHLAVAAPRARAAGGGAVARLLRRLPGGDVERGALARFDAGTRRGRQASRALSRGDAGGDHAMLRRNLSARPHPVGAYFATTWSIAPKIE